LRFLFANRQFHHLLDQPFPTTDILGLSLGDVLPRDAQRKLQWLARQASRAARVTSREGLRLEGFIGGPVYWDVTATPIHDTDTGVEAIMLQALDVTEKVRVAEENERLLALADQRAAQLSAALERIADGVVVVDVEGKVRRINRAAIAMLDLDTPEALAQDSLGEETPGGDGGGRFQVELPPLHLSLRGQTVYNFVHGIQRRNSRTTWLSISSAPLYDRLGNVHGAVAGFHDISERRQIEQMKDDFLAVTAHELRTPVTALLGYTNLMIKRTEQSDWTDRDIHALRMIEAQAQRLTQLVNGLIDLSRVQTGAIELRHQRVDLRALVEQAAGAQRMNAVEHTIVVETPEEAIMVEVDPQRLDQVVSHLIGNALKYSPWGGTVQVKAWLDDVAHVAVIDDGIGIPEDALPLLFERFYRATNIDTDRISGLGIGLYLVKELVAVHGGEIDVRSAPEQGTTVEITLPLTREQGIGNREQGS
jgi:two-component system phosphate regulon sensor histidine kinase PhoR